MDILPPSSERESRTLSARSSKHSGRTYDDDRWYETLSISSGRDEWRFTACVGGGAVAVVDTAFAGPPPVSISTGTDIILDTPEGGAGSGPSALPWPSRSAPGMPPILACSPFDRFMASATTSVILAEVKLPSSSCMPSFDGSVGTLYGLTPPSNLLCCSFPPPQEDADDDDDDDDEEEDESSSSSSNSFGTPPAPYR